MHATHCAYISLAYYPFFPTIICRSFHRDQRIYRFRCKKGDGLSMKKLKNSADVRLRYGVVWCNKINNPSMVHQRIRKISLDMADTIIACAEANNKAKAAQEYAPKPCKHRSQKARPETPVWTGYSCVLSKSLDEPIDIHPGVFVVPHRASA